MLKKKDDELIKEKFKSKERADDAIQAKDYAIKSKENELKRADLAISKLEAEVVQEKANVWTLRSENAAIVAPRPLIETWCAQLYPRLTSSATVNEIT